MTTLSCRGTAGRSTAARAGQPARANDGAPRAPLTRGQTLAFPLGDRAALACMRFQARAIGYGNVTTAAAGRARLPQPSGGLRDAVAAHPRYLGNAFVRRRQFVRGQPVEA